MSEETRLRIATGGYNWLAIATEILLGLEGSGYPDPNVDYEWDRNTSKVSVVSPPTNRAALSTVELVGRRQADVAITTPTGMAAMARDGKGPFSQEHDVAAIARLPHRDWVGFAVMADSGIESLDQIREEQRPLCLARTLPHYPPHRNVTGYLVDAVLDQYKVSDRLIRRWGGEVDYGGRRLVDGMKSGEFDALFDEAMMTPGWRKIAESVDLRFLPVDEDVLEFLSRSHGVDRGVIPEGYLPGVERDTPTVDMSGWLVVTRGDVGEDVAYHVARAIDERKRQIRERFLEKVEGDSYTEPPLTSSIDMNEAARETKVELHAGARRYYEDEGYL